MTQEERIELDRQAEAFASMVVEFLSNESIKWVPFDSITEVGETDALHLLNRRKDIKQVRALFTEAATEAYRLTVGEYPPSEADSKQCLDLTGMLICIRLKAPYHGIELMTKREEDGKG